MTIDRFPSFQSRYHLHESTREPGTHWAKMACVLLEVPVVNDPFTYPGEGLTPKSHPEVRLNPRNSSKAGFGTEK